ncbi:MAG: hypothetical protein HY344_01245 [Candidatus Levybacteria bacterium]|nr:hypothetical protein [Candidatus Levybacteria bacterium]
MTLLPISLTKDFIPIVKIGQKVSNGQTIARKKDQGQENIIHLKDFSITPKDLESSLKKHLGDAVMKGETVAIKKKLFGGKKILSEVDGTISKIDDQTCDVYIQTAKSAKEETIISPVEGTVDFCNNGRIVLKTTKTVVAAKDAFGWDATGELVFIKPPVKLSEDIEGKIIAVDKADKLLLYKAIGLSAIGIITSDLEEVDFIDFEERKINAAIMLLERQEFEKLEKINGKKILCDVEGKAIIIL